MHDCFVPGLGAVIERRLGATHRMGRIDARRRTLDDLPSALKGVPSYLYGAALAALDEGRASGMYWLLMTPQPEAEASADAMMPLIEAP
jgi:hypothetical protein